MVQILLGALAFAAALALDWASCLRLPRLKPLLSLSAAVMLGTALVWTLATPGRYDWPAWTLLAGWPLLLVTSALLFYSLFVEIPLTAAYIGRSAGDTLVTTGTYGLVRHPGVLWFGLWMLGWVLVDHGRLLLVAAIVWVLLDVVLVCLEEALFFDKMFPGYAEYRKTTPMLVPTPRSISRCVRSLLGRPRQLLPRVDR